MRPRLACAGALLAAAVAVAACGGGSSSDNSGGGTGTTDLASASPSQILSAVKRSLASATSVRINGRVNQGSKVATFDLTTFANGSYAGTVTMNGSTVRLVRIGTTDYLEAPKSFYESQGASAAVAQLLDGKWVYGPDSQVGIGNDFTLSSLSSQITKPNGPVTKGATATVDGVTALALHSRQGTLWVATSGSNHPVKLEKSGATGGVVHFSAWNRGAVPSAPAGAVSLNSLSAPTP